MANVVNLGVLGAPQSRRTTRRPSNPFSMSLRPYTIQPFMCHPVLPGETLKNLTCNMSVVLQSVKNELSGWWLESYLFYVKHRDLSISDELQAMVLNPGTTVSADAGVNNGYYHNGLGTSFAKHCTVSVVENYFRDEGEAWDVHTIDGMPIATVQMNNWTDSLSVEGEQAFDIDVDLDADGTVTTSEIEESMRMWQQLTAQGNIAMTYEQWLQTYGVNIPQIDIAGRPELLRDVRQWHTPRLGVNAEGTPANNIRWDMRYRADKNRFFKEPGFILGLNVIRPKVFLKNQKESVTASMRDAYAWMPAMLLEDRHSSMIDQPTLQNVTGSTATLSFDIRDLMTRGEQFLGVPLTNTPYVTLPDLDGLNKKYPSQTDITDLFETNYGLAKIDGVVNMSIATKVSDLSQTTAL